MLTNLSLPEAFRDLLESDFVTEETRRVLGERLNLDSNYAPQFFNAHEFATFRAICDALAPSKVVPCDFVAQEIDKRLAGDKGNGWRYDEMPPDGETYKMAVLLFNDAAQQIFANDFAAITNQQRIEIIRKMRDDSSDYLGSVDITI